jgi:hypothetical protein
VVAAGSWPGFVPDRPGRIGPGLAGPCDLSAAPPRVDKNFEVGWPQFLDVGPKHNLGKPCILLVLDVFMHQLDVVWIHSAAMGPTRDGLFDDLPGPVGTAVS